MRVKVLQTKTSPIKLLALTLTRTGTVSDAGSAFDRYRVVPLCAIRSNVNRDGARHTDFRRMGYSAEFDEIHEPLCLRTAPLKVGIICIPTGVAPVEIMVGKDRPG